MSNSVVPNADDQGDFDRLNSGIKKNNEADQRVEEAAKRGDLITLYRELQGEAAKTALRMFRKYNNSNKGDPRLLTEASREARQLTDRLLELIAAEGAAAQADEFLADIQRRVEATAPLLVEVAHPIAPASP